LFRGNIGFTVHPAHRGCHYAARSCLLLVPLIRHHHQTPVWLTCADGNVASQRTIESLGARFLEVREIPPDWPYLEDYPLDQRRKRRYRWDAYGMSD
jgi:tagatose 1,6-diphosphate aldolase